MLLSLLRSHVSSWLDSGSNPPVLASTLALASVCAAAAQESIGLLQECWLEGSFATFDHIYAQYLFSDAVVLSMSTLLDKVDVSSSVDQQRGRLEYAREVLQELSSSGHLAAVEWYRKIEAIRSATLELESRRQTSVGAMRVPQWKQTSDGLATGSESSTTQEASSDQVSYLGRVASEFNLDLQYMDDMLSQDISQGLYWPSFD